MMLVISLALGLGLLGQVHGASVTTTSYNTADCTGDPAAEATPVETFCGFCVPYGDEIYVIMSEENGMCAYTDSSCSTPDESGAAFGGAYGAVACVNGCMDVSQEYNGIFVTASVDIAMTCDDDYGDECMTQIMNDVQALYTVTENVQCDVIDNLFGLLSGDCAGTFGSDDPCADLTDDNLAPVVTSCGYCPGISASDDTSDDTMVSDDFKADDFTTSDDTTSGGTGNTFTGINFGSDDSGCVASMMTAIFGLASATEDNQCDAVDAVWELMTGDCAAAMGITSDDPCDGAADATDDMADIIQGCGYCDSSAKMTTVVVGLFAVVATFLL